MAVTIKDVSAQCGLSVSAVSKALNNYDDVSEATKKLVKKTAREMGYYPNAVARALKTNRSYHLGILFMDESHSGLTHHFFMAVLDSFKKYAESQGYDITFIHQNVGKKHMTFLEHCRYRQVDGICIACLNFYDDEVQALVNSDIPCVTIDHVFNNSTSILSENCAGMQAITKCAISKGHKKIAYVHGQASAVTDYRLAGYYQAMQEAGLAVPPGYVVAGHYDNPVEGGKSVRKLLSLPFPPTCILMPDDYTTLGVIDAVHSMGLSVPEDVSLGGYDGIALMQMLRPKLTTIAQDTKAMGAKAAEALINKIENPNTALNEIIWIAGELLEGDSIGNIDA